MKQILERPSELAQGEPRARVERETQLVVLRREDVDVAEIKHPGRAAVRRDREAVALECEPAGSALLAASSVCILKFA